ncbi:hypothetical protein HWV62_34485 [Athelia sp. TMB]|nr:hypothetical protein HWV62_34485 [Athelia sp. TMB]
MQNYRPRDKICLFGFSRGAYTARALAGMLYKVVLDIFKLTFLALTPVASQVGLVPPHNDQQVDFAFDLYQATDPQSAETAAEFKSTFSMPVIVKFVGVWDTVSSVGIIPRSLPYSSGTLGVEYFRHALALDERRARFRPNVWAEPTSVMPESLLPDFGPPDSTPDNWMERLPLGTDVKEVWFPGCHADVGGGSHKTMEIVSLSRLSLRWMIKECMEAEFETGLVFDDKYLGTIGLYPAGTQTAMQCGPAVAPQNNPVSMSQILMPVSQPKEQRDIFAKIYDQFYLAKHWWILEVLPLSATIQIPDGTWMRFRL